MLHVQSRAIAAQAFWAVHSLSGGWRRVVLQEACPGGSFCRFCTITCDGCFCIRLPPVCSYAASHPLSACCRAAMLKSMVPVFCSTAGGDGAAANGLRTGQLQAAAPAASYTARSRRPRAHQRCQAAAPRAQPRRSGAVAAGIVNRVSAAECLLPAPCAPVRAPLSRSGLARGVLLLTSCTEVLRRFAGWQVSVSMCIAFLDNTADNCMLAPLCAALLCTRSTEHARRAGGCAHHPGSGAHQRHCALHIHLHGRRGHRRAAARRALPAQRNRAGPERSGDVGRSNSHVH